MVLSIFLEDVVLEHVSLATTFDVSGSTIPIVSVSIFIPTFVSIVVPFSSAFLPAEHTSAADVATVDVDSVEPAVDAIPDANVAVVAVLFYILKMMRLRHLLLRTMQIWLLMTQLSLFNLEDDIVLVIDFAVDQGKVASSIFATEGQSGKPLLRSNDASLSEFDAWLELQSHSTNSAKSLPHEMTTCVRKRSLVPLSMVNAKRHRLSVSITKGG
ncbi:hypothetical protein V6N12_044997 [Hibiscus sabdariffa]|uniref:Uncharacterized protein n=1 Tax=Hibiscus sabdariffa TaxID=183260 RepID=A0ABR2G1J3_9ROSI